MDPVEVLRRCGGRASVGELKAAGVRARGIARAVAGGQLTRTRPGHYRLAELSTALDVAIGLSAVLSHRSAALHHGLEVATSPDKPEVIVRRDRHLAPAQRRLAAVRWRELGPADADGSVTSVLRTLTDCSRDLPFGQALAVADSVLRHQMADKAVLNRLAGEQRGKGSVAVRRVLRAADAQAANAFESSLRAIALEADLDVRPQVQVTEAGLFAQVDLADEGRRLAVEAESFAFHAQRRGFRKDVRRYSELAVHGWTILRFTWEDVMFQPDYVRWALESWRRWHDHGARAEAPPAHLPRLA